MRYLFLCALLTACGGAVEDDAPSPAPVTNAPSSVNSEAAGCTRACDRMTKTCRAYEDARCAESCASNFDTDEQAATFAACIDALSCEDIQRGAFMNYGPIGECWTRARRGP